MKKMTTILGALLISSTVFAGSDNFECTAYSLNKSSGKIHKLLMNTNSVTLDDSEIADRGGSPFELIGEQIYTNKKTGSAIKAQVSEKSEALSLKGNIGQRDHYVRMSLVDIKLSIGKSLENFSGSCTETIITTCGGICQD